MLQCNSIVVKDLFWSTRQSTATIQPMSAFEIKYAGGCDYEIKLELAGPRNGYRSHVYMSIDKTEELGHAILEVVRRIRRDREGITT